MNRHGQNVDTHMWAARTLPQILAAQAAGRPHAPALLVVDPDTSTRECLNYQELEERTNRVANALRTCGIEYGDRVAVLAHNSREFVECLLAVAKLGAVFVPLNAASTSFECCYILSSCQVKLLIAEEELLVEEIEQLVPMVVCIRTAYENHGAFRGSELTYEELVSCASTEFEEPNISAGDLVEIMFTSGTTSRPKGVMLTHANFAFSGHYVMWELGMKSEDRYLSAMSASHINLQLSALLPTLTSGACLVLLRRYSATTFWRDVRETQATLIQAMAMVVRTLSLQPYSPGEKEHKVREVHYFLPISKKEKEEFEERFGVRLLNNYGSTESLVGVLTDPPTGVRNWPSIGKPGPGYDVKIVGEDGHTCSEGVCGEIWIRGEIGVSLMAGYWKDEAATSAVFEGSWYRSGDWGYEKEGWIYFVDRRADLIKRAGENVSASEIESVLRAAPGVGDAAVIGIPDDIRDEAIKAVVVPKAGERVNISKIREYAQAHLSYFKVPQYFEIRSELPLGEYGKVVKSALRGSFAANERKSINDDQD